MVESQIIVSGKLGEKLVCLPTQRYDAPSRKFRGKFVATLLVGLDGICYWKWNSVRVIVFQSVIRK